MGKEQRIEEMARLLARQNGYNWDDLIAYGESGKEWNDILDTHWRSEAKYDSEAWIAIREAQDAKSYKIGLEDGYAKAKEELCQD